MFFVFEVIFDIVDWLIELYLSFIVDSFKVKSLTKTYLDKKILKKKSLLE